MTGTPPRGLVAFDLDGTLLRGRTVCELLAAASLRVDGPGRRGGRSAG